MPDPVSATPSPSKMQVFLRRLVSSVVLWTVILAAMFSGNRFIADGVFLLIVAFLALVGLVEFYGLAQKRGLACFKVSGVIGGSVTMAMVVACLIGLTVPAVLHRWKLDPKIAAGPVSLAIADVCTLLIYLNVAVLVL